MTPEKKMHRFGEAKGRQMINGEEMLCGNSSVMMLMIFMVINDDDVVIDE